MRVVFFACVMDSVLFERLNVNETRICFVAIFVMHTRGCVCVCVHVEILMFEKV